jgi:two-component system sensor histidine kinase/response regulator
MAASHMEHPPKKILLVDDSPKTVAHFSSLLEAEGYATVCAFDGPDGIVAARREQPDLILLDVEMPRLSGLSVCRILRSDPLFECTPVVLLTSREDQDMIARGIAMGANDYVVKSARCDELLARVGRLLSTRDSFKEHVSEARLVAISQLALSIQHEIYNPLTAVIGFLDMVLRDSELSDRNRKYIEMARGEAARIEGITARLTSIEDRPVDRFGVGEMIDLGSAATPAD